MINKTGLDFSMEAAAAHLSEGPLGIGGLASYFSRKPLVRRSATVFSWQSSRKNDRTRTAWSLRMVSRKNVGKEMFLRPGWSELSTKTVNGALANS